MDHRAIILDGITTQHVGEVLFDAPATDDIRSRCRTTYLRSIEDFVCGVLFGENLTLSGRMPPVGDSTPGAMLIQDPALRGFVVTLDMASPTDIGALLTRVGLRASVENDLNAITRLGPAEMEPFRHFYIREIAAYLGDHPSIFEPGLDPPTYDFSTRHRASHYVRDASLQALVPAPFVTAMVATVRENGVPPRVAGDALNEFVTCVLVTHVANYWGFDYAAESQPHGSVRLPHVTRALIRKHADEPDAGEERPDAGEERPDAGQERLRRRVYEVIVPRALLQVITVAREQRGAFLDALRETRDSRRFQAIRLYLTELVHQISQGNRREANTLLDMVAKTSAQGGLQQESLSLSIPVIGDRLQRLLNPGKYYLRQLILRSGYRDEADYQAKVERVFPSLRH